MIEIRAAWLNALEQAMGFNLWRLKMFKDPQLRKPWFKTIAGVDGVGTQDLYFWGDARKYGYKCNFHATWGYNLRPDIMSRNQEYQVHACQNFKGAVTDIIATLIKKL